MTSTGRHRWFHRVWTFRCRLLVFLALCCHDLPTALSTNTSFKVRRIRGAPSSQTEKRTFLASNESLVTHDALAPPARLPNRPTLLRGDAGHDIPLASMTVPLHAHEYTHHVYIHVGSPNPQRQTLILDTGSRYTAFPCEPFCQQCGNHHSQKFNTTKSTTLKTNEPPNCAFPKVKKDISTQEESCVFRQSYLEGSSWTAKVSFFGDDFSTAVIV